MKTRVRHLGSSTPRALLATLVIVIAAGVGFFAYRAFNEPDAAALKPVEAPAASAAATQPAPKAEAPARKIPDMLPDITLADRDGKPTPLSTFANRPLMVNFWATWCAPCRKEIPLLNKIRAQRRAQNVEIVGIAVDFKDKVDEFLKKVPVEYPVLVGEEEGYAAADAFGMELLLPFSVFIDSQNRILTVKVGELHEDEANFAFDRLRDIDNGALTREQAQEHVQEAFKAMAAERARTQAADHSDHAE